MTSKAKDDRSISQRQKFINSARELGCDEDESHFEEKLKQVARQKPHKEPPPAPKKMRRDK